jgi:hypothetical protein
MKYLIILLILPFAATAQSTQGVVFNGPALSVYNPNKIDTVRTTLHITNSKLSKLQYVPGYVVLQNGRVKGYLSRQRKPLPKKVEVWGYH